jgi:hypothetical protein
LVVVYPECACLCSAKARSVDDASYT